MRLKQYITEGIREQDIEKLQEGMELVYTHCMPYINDLIKGGFNYLRKDDQLLYSGRNSDSLIINKKVRTDRKPSDMKVDLHKLYDDLFYKRFKVHARSNAIFCTGVMMVAAGYGNTVYAIFPVGKYQVIWSDDIYDLYNDYSVSNIIKKYKDLSDEEFLKEMDDKVISSYHKGDVMKAIRSKNEIMLTCKSYIGLKNYKFNRVARQYIEMNKDKFPEKEFFMEWYNRYIGL